jgi:hypothetical protein
MGTIVSEEPAASIPYFFLFAHFDTEDGVGNHLAEAYNVSS